MVPIREVRSWCADCSVSIRTFSRLAVNSGSPKVPEILKEDLPLVADFSISRSRSTMRRRAGD